MSTTETEAKARTLGWRPKEEFRGKPEDFVEAEVFVARGREVMPILKENNAKLEAKLSKADQKIADLERAVADSQTAVSELKKFNTEMTRQAAEQAKADLLAQLKQAKKDGDTDREVELTDQLTETSAALREAKRAPTKEEGNPPEKKPNGGDGPDVAASKAEFGSWKADNDWYGTDIVKTSVANGIAQKLRAEKSPLTGVEFYKEVAKQTEALLDKNEKPAGNKVEGGGRGTGGGSGGGKGGKAYNDMPQEARDACEKFMKRDITIGKGKTFETADAFRKYYAETFFARSE